MSGNVAALVVAIVAGAAGVVAADDSQRDASDAVPRVDLSAGYGRDEFSFASAGNMGYFAAAVVTNTERIAGQYERWNKFGEVADRVGVSASRRATEHLWIRASSMFAPGAGVIARADLSAGLSRAWSNGVVVNGDYRRLEFAGVHVDVASPGLEYYVPHRSLWLSATMFQSWTRFDRSPAAVSNRAFAVQCRQQVAAPAALRIGYARGNESFAAVSIDRIGTFLANTYFGGVDIRITAASNLTTSYAFQQRSNGAVAHTVGIGLNLRR
jgi:YaiO family outer membrane protein